jgi:hypothetical protein
MKIAETKSAKEFVLFISLRSRREQEVLANKEKKLCKLNSLEHLPKSVRK